MDIRGRRRSTNVEDRRGMRVGRPALGIGLGGLVIMLVLSLLGINPLPFMAGLQEAQEWTPDMVFCDIGLPVMDGYEVARQLRRDPHTAHTRLVALTGYGQEEDRARSLAAGFDEHLIKPAEPAALADVLRSPIGEPQRRQEEGEITR